jgi:phosphate transport system permease protein
MALLQADSSALTTSATSLASRTLPRGAVPGLAIASLGLTALLFAVAPFGGFAGYVVFSGIVFLAAQTATSFAVEGRRHAVDRFASALIHTTFLIALLPLLSVVWKVLAQGTGQVNGHFLTHSMRNVGVSDTGGGIYHSMIGTLLQGLITSLISIPIALLVAVYLVEYGTGKLARSVTFFVDVMTGIPSIVAGLFVYTVWVLTLGFERSGFAAALALTILMVPTVVRSTEEMLKLVPNELREASYALGVPKWCTILRIVIPTALPGIITGIMLGIARVIGETAPLLLLIGGTDSINFNALDGPQSALPLFIYDQAGRPNPEAIDRAWGAALALILIVMILNLVARSVARLTRVR